MAEINLAEGVLGAIVTVLSGVFGAVWKRLDRHEDDTKKETQDIWTAIAEQRRDLSDHKEQNAKDYITRADFTRLEAKIDRLLEMRAS